MLVCSWFGLKIKIFENLVKAEADSLQNQLNSSKEMRYKIFCGAALGE